MAQMLMSNVIGHLLQSVITLILLYIVNKGLNKFADFLNKSADKIKNSNSENKED